MSETAQVIYDEFDFNPPQGLATRIAMHLKEGRQVVACTQIIKPPKFSGMPVVQRWVLVLFQPPGQQAGPVEAEPARVLTG